MAQELQAVKNLPRIKLVIYVIYYTLQYIVKGLWIHQNFIFCPMSFYIVERTPS